MYVVMNVLTLPPQLKSKVSERFKDSAEKMRRVEGCVEFQFLSHTDEGIVIIYTKWSSKEAYQNWVDSDEFKQAHIERRKKASQEGNPAQSKIETYEVIHHT